MTIRTVLPVLCVSICFSGAMAQTAAQEPPANASKPKAADAKPDAAKPDAAKPDAAKPDAPKPAVRETPPDVKAYSEATAIKDLDKRIEALAKWKMDFPTSQM